MWCTFKKITFVKCNQKVSIQAVWRGNQMHYGYMGRATAVNWCCDCFCNSKILCHFLSSTFNVAKWNGRLKECNMHQVLCQPWQNSLRLAECFKKPFLIMLWLECKPSNAIHFSYFIWRHRMFMSPIIRSDGWKFEKVRKSSIMARDISVICDKSAIIFCECKDDVTVLQRRVLQTALWHYTC
jgi:hypothetical protein